MFLHLLSLVSLLVSLLRTLGQMIFTCRPLVSLLVSLLVALVSLLVSLLFTLVLHLSRRTLDTLGRMFIHLTPTCLGLL